MYPISTLLLQIEKVIGQHFLLHWNDNQAFQYPSAFSHEILISYQNKEQPLKTVLFYEEQSAKKGDFKISFLLKTLLLKCKEIQKDLSNPLDFWLFLFLRGHGENSFYAQADLPSCTETLRQEMKKESKFYTDLLAGTSVQAKEYPQSSEPSLGSSFRGVSVCKEDNGLFRHLLAEQREILKREMSSLLQTNIFFEKNTRESLLWKAQNAPFQLTEEEILFLAQPLFLSYQTLYERQVHSLSGSSQRTPPVDPDDTRTSKKVELLLKNLRTYSSGTEEYVLDLLKKKKLYKNQYDIQSSPEDLTKSVDLYQEWLAHLCLFDAGNLHPSLDAPASCLPTTQRPRYVAEIWIEFLVRLESYLQVFLRSNTFQKSMDVIPYTTEYLEYLYDFVDSIDSWMRRTPSAEREPIEDFLENYLELWGIIEVKITEDTIYNAMLHDHGGFERAAPDEAYHLRVLRRGFNEILDGKNLRRPIVAILDRR